MLRTAPMQIRYYTTVNVCQEVRAELQIMADTIIRDNSVQRIVQFSGGL